MRITSVTFTEELTAETEGLRDVRMHRLGQVVAIAGPNGAGKSRLLRAIQQIRGQGARVGVRTNLEAHRTQREKAAARGEPTDWHDAVIAKIELELKFIEAFEVSGLELERHFEHLPFFGYVPDASRTGDYRKQSLEKLQALPDMSKLDTRVGGHVQPYIVNVIQRYWDTRHQESEASEAERIEAERTYEALNDTIEAFLGARLESSPGRGPKLFGRPLPESGLSDGQNVLLKIAVAVHTQGQNLDGSVLFLDEPETHLHPKALADFLARLRTLNPSGQIWLATHSLHLLAQCEQDEIWFIDDGVVRWGGKTPERVIRGLTGDDETAGKLVEFLDWPAQLASSRFAAECLVPPTSVWTDEHDDQCQQIRRIIEARELERPRILDWGAGKGRILAALRDLGELDYYAFEPDESDAEALAALVGDHLSDSTRRVFSKQSELDLPAGVDVVVMSNVLHEIPPGEWLPLFKRGSALSRALGEDGHLLVVEDHLIPKGELAHEHGFLILGKPELRALFAITAEDEAAERFVAVEAREGRLGAYLIAKPLLARATRETRAEALEHLVDRAKARVRELRRQDASYRVGREYGFWTQQFTNASLAVEAL